MITGMKFVTGGPDKKFKKKRFGEKSSIPFSAFSISYKIQVSIGNLGQKMTENLFKWKHYESGIIVLCISWYMKYPLSYRMLEEMMA